MPTQQATPTTAERFFTNRENYFTAFQKSLDNIFSKEYSVLYFYGLGGIGKSRLKRELSRSLKQKKDKHVFISDALNFEKAKFRSPDSALYTLYTDLKKNKIDFPSFEIAYAIYWQKLNPELKLSQSGLPFLDEGGIVTDFVSVLGDLPLVSLLPKVVSVLHKIKKSYTDWWTKKGEKELSVLQSLEVFQIEELLPYYFALDLKDFYLVERERVVFFVDTYEALWSKQDERKNEKFFAKDKWVRTLIANLPNTLWVIFGREHLRWAEIPDDNWGDFIEQHRLGELSFIDSDRFLEACNISDADIRKQIIKTSEGLPFYLDLQVDTYDKIITRGNKPAVDDFAKRYADILSRFIMYLEPSEIETLKLLSFARQWKFELFSLLIKEFQTGYPATSFAELQKFSFINLSRDGVNFSIHQIMRDHLQETVDEKQKQRIHTFLFSYYDYQINQNRNASERKVIFFEFNSFILSNIEEAIYHKQCIDTPVGYYNWLLDTSKTLYGETNSNLLHEALDKAFDELNFYESYQLLINISSEIARLYSWKNNFKLTRSYINTGLDLCRKTLDEKYNGQEEDMIKEEPALITLQTDLLVQQADLFNDMDRNIEAFQIYQQAFSMGEKIGYKPNKWTYANLLLEIGKLPEAESYFYEQLRTAINTADEDFSALVYTKLGTIFFLQQLYKEASIYFQKSITLYKKTRGDDHKYYWICRKKYAEAILNLGDTEQALSILQETLDWYLAKYGDTYADNGFVYVALAKCQLRKGEIYNGLDNLISGANLLREKYGSTNSNVWEGIMLYCDTMQSIREQNIELTDVGFDEKEAETVIGIYNLFISSTEWIVNNNFEGFKQNFGANSEVLKLFFKVLECHYKNLGLEAEKTQLINKRNEVNRVMQSQWKIRLFDNLTFEEIDAESRQNLLSKLSRYIGVEEDIPVTLRKTKLPFYKKTNFYCIVFSDKVRKYVFELNNQLWLLDWTNAPLYSIGQTDFELSAATVTDYLLFFFDAVKGSHGKFYFPMSGNDIPYRLDVEVTDEIHSLISEKIQQLSIIKESEDSILLKGCCFFKDSLFSCDAKIDKKGVAYLENEECVLENLPVAADVFMQSIALSYDNLLSRIKFGVSNIFLGFTEELAMEQTEAAKLEETLALLSSFEASADLDPSYAASMNNTLDSCVYFIEKYIKPKFDEFFYSNDIGAILDFITKIKAINHSVIEKEK